MADVFYNFTYDGTLDGLYCVFLRCISTRISPKNIRPDYIPGIELESDRYIHVNTNCSLARSFYDYVGRFSGSLVQRMLMEIFLTGLPNRELDMYMLIRKALWRGESVSSDFTDNDLRRIQMAIRELYRESQGMLPELVFSEKDTTAISVINPRNRVLPIVMDNILCDTRLDDFMVFDQRHKMVLLRNDDKDYVLDINNFLIESESGTDYLYRNVWNPLVEEGRIRKLRPIHICGKQGDSPTFLWDIAN